MDDNDGVKIRTRLGFLSQDELAAMLDVARETLREWRRQKIGPDFVRFGKVVMYREQDVHAWMEKNLVPVDRVA